MKIIDRDGLMKNCDENGKRFKNNFATLIQKYP